LFWFINIMDHTGINNRFQLLLSPIIFIFVNPKMTL